MQSHFGCGLLEKSLLLVVSISQLTMAFGQSSQNVITTVVNANGCFTEPVNGKPLVFCRGGFTGDGGPAETAKLGAPMGIAVDKSGNLFIADGGSWRVRRVDADTGIITTVAGNSVCRSGACKSGFSGDGGPATKAELHNTFGGVALDADGNLFICDSGNNRVRRVDHATGIITTVAGNGTRGSGGDGGPATKAELKAPKGVSVDTSGNLFIADYGNRRVRRVDNSTGVISTVAGGGNSCRFRKPPAVREEQCLAVDADLGEVGAVLVDATGDLYIAEPFRGSEIRRVDHVTGLISWISGGGCPPQGGSCGAGFEGDGGPAIDARLRAPNGLAMDGAGNLFIADTGNGRIRRIDHATGIITTVAGSGGKDFGRDGEPATSTALNLPFGVAVDGAENLFIADTDSESVRKMKLVASDNAADTYRERGQSLAPRN
jgi:sugar lactone lactonase YvrE